MIKEELMQLIALNLRKYRDEQNLTQEEVAESAGISTAFLANIERGCKIMSVPVLRNLADSLGVSTDDLLYEEQADRLSAITALLRDKPDSFVQSMEKLIRLAIDEFYQQERDR